MKIETILNAMLIATQEYCKKTYDLNYLDRKLRQATAFRARILRMYDDVQEEVDILWRLRDHQDARIAELEAKIHHPSKKYLLDAPPKVGKYISASDIDEWFDNYDEWRKRWSDIDD